MFGKPAILGGQGYVVKWPGKWPLVGKPLQWPLVLYALLGCTLAQAQSDELILGRCSHSYATPADAECGTLQVPENPKAPRGAQLTLNVMRVPAANKTAADPLFVIVGGPGGAAVKTAMQYLPYFRGVQQKRDLVFVDQRGTGDSNGLNCPFEQIQFAPLSDEERQQKARELAVRCRQQLEADLRFYTTPYAVQDLEQVRQSLGYERVNLWGVSYGTRVILDYMRQYPAAIRAAVLDGVAPVAIQLPRFAAEDGSRALNRLLDYCASEPSCAAAYGNLRGDWLGLLAELEDKPRHVTLVHPRSQAQVPVLVTPAILSSWVQLSLYSRELAPLLPRAMAQAAAGDFTVFGTIGLMASDQLFEHVSQGMQATVICAEDRYFAREIADKNTASPDAEESPALLQLERPELFDQLCEAFPSAHLPADYFAPVKSAVPTLLLSGNLDPVTPPRWAEQAAQHLSNSHHLVVEGAHHGVTMQGCMPRLVRQFIEAADPAAVDAACAELIQPQPFFIDGAGPNLSSQAVGGGRDD